MATSQVSPVTVSMTRPSTHQPTFVYDQTAPAGRSGSISRDEPRQRAVVRVAMRRETEFERRAQREPGAVRKQVANGRDARPIAPPRSSGTCAETGSSSDRRPASANTAITVATIDLVNDPALKRVSAVTASPVPTLAVP